MYRLDGWRDGRLSTNFWRREFACKCGCGFSTVDTELITLCEEIRAFEGHKALRVSSGCRCEENNLMAGGAKDSQHLQGKAADLQVRDPDAVYLWLRQKFPERYGIGVYDDRIHIDVREGAATWDARTRRPPESG